MLTRAFSTAALKVVNNVAKQQFECNVRGVDAILAYEKCGKHIVFTNTEVPDQCQGKGVGKLLAKSAFQYAVDNKLHVTCRCHFLAKYYEDNIKQYKNLKVIFELDDEEQK